MSFPVPWVAMRDHKNPSKAHKIPWVLVGVTAGSFRTRLLSLSSRRCPSTWPFLFLRRCSSFPAIPSAPYHRDRRCESARSFFWPYCPSRSVSNLYTAPAFAILEGPLQLPGGVRLRILPSLLRTRRSLQSGDFDARRPILIGGLSPLFPGTKITTSHFPVYRFRLDYLPRPFMNCQGRAIASLVGWPLCATTSSVQ